MEGMDTTIASLSTYTKQLLSGQIERLEAEILTLDIEASSETDLERESALRQEIGRKHQQIADLQVLVTEVPTLEDSEDEQPPSNDCEGFNGYYLHPTEGWTRSGWPD